jgi:peroxiredoxin
MLLRKPTSRIGSLTFQTQKYKRCSPRGSSSWNKDCGNQNKKQRVSKLPSSSTPNKYLNISLKDLQNMSLRINDIAPDFTAETTQGPIHFHEWIGNNWAVLFSHPKDFTPVCTTELGAVAGLEKQFADRGAKVIGLSVDPVKSHGKWAQDIQDVSGHKVNYPIIGDTELKVAKLLRHATSRRR